MKRGPNIEMVRLSIECPGMVPHFNFILVYSLILLISHPFSVKTVRHRTLEIHNTKVFFYFYL